MTARWLSQQFPPDGSTASDGIRRQLGAPTLDPLVVLLRETAQNSWDARLEERGVVELDYRIERLGSDWVDAFRSRLLPGPVGDLADLDSSLDETAVVLCVSDRRTTGLGGPLRSDVDDGQRDFVNFVRNAGEPRDREFGGGTYGFGKGALFRISRPGVILVDTVCRTSTGLERRLIGAALGHAFNREGKRYTGRHWWGTDAGGVVDPLLDGRAGDMARDLGLRGFEDGATGTDVYVIAADLGETASEQPRSLREAGEILASAGLWYLWPKLLIDRGRGGIDLKVHADGQQLPVPDPRKTGRLRCFVEALDELDAGNGIEKTRTRAPRSVGFFAARTDLWSQRPDPVVDAAAPFDGRSHHCARMRHIELVVDYVRGDELADPDHHYGAVFRAVEDRVVEEAFAAAEPPTHDAWNTQHLSGSQMGIVRDAGTFVRSELALVVNPEGLRAGDGTDVPLASLSRSLAAVLPAAGGDGADGRPARRGGGGGGGGGRARVRATGGPRLVVRDGEAVVSQVVTFADSAEPVAAGARAVVAVDGGAEQTVPVGASEPVVLGWESDSAGWIPGDRLVVDREAPREWTVYVRPAPDTSTVVRVWEVRT